MKPEPVAAMAGVNHIAQPLRRDGRKGGKRRVIERGSDFVDGT